MGSRQCKPPNRCLVCRNIKLAYIGVLLVDLVEKYRAIPGLPGGSINYQGHLFSQTGHVCLQRSHRASQTSACEGRFVRLYPRHRAGPRYACAHHDLAGGQSLPGESFMPNRTIFWPLSVFFFFALPSLCCEWMTSCGLQGGR